jgi:hypothetical protein
MVVTNNYYSKKNQQQSELPFLSVEQLSPSPMRLLAAPASL